MHIKLLDTDGDLHVIPKKKMYLSSCIKDNIFQVVILEVNIDNIEITKKEFERLVILFDYKDAK